MELNNGNLASALTNKLEFTQKEWDAFGISGLCTEHFIKSRDVYFKPSDDPQQFLDKMIEAGGAVAIRLAIAQLRPRIEPVLKEARLLWGDVAPVLEMIDTVEQLKGMVQVDAPEALLKTIARA
eukprot:2465556-Prymnesium_polylepis.1